MKNTIKIMTASILLFGLISINAQAGEGYEIGNKAKDFKL